MADEAKDLTIEILKDIRDAARGTNARLEQTNERIDHTNERLDETNERIEHTNERLDETNERLETMNDNLGRRIVASEIRTATAITDLAGTVRDLTTVLRASADLRPRVERCELDIAELKGRRG